MRLSATGTLCSLASMALICSQALQARQTVLDLVVNAYNKVQGYQIEAVVTNRVLSQVQTKTILIAWSPPDRLRLEDGTHKAITVFHDNGRATYASGASSWRTGPANDPLRSNNAVSRRQAMAEVGFADYTAIEDNLGSTRVLCRKMSASTGRQYFAP